MENVTVSTDTTRIDFLLASRKSPTWICVKNRVPEPATAAALDDTSRHRMRLSASRQQLLVRKRPGVFLEVDIDASLPTGMMRS